jgi:predicted anti-sigma-YlaC factor YlaD
MNCSTFRANLGALLTGDVPDQERAALTSHSRGCTDCRNLYESRATLRRIISRSRVDEQLPSALADLVESTKRDKRR